MKRSKKKREIRNLAIPICIRTLGRTIVVESLYTFGKIGFFASLLLVF